MKQPLLIAALFWLTFVPVHQTSAQEKVIIASSSNMDAETNGAYVWSQAFIQALKETGFEPVFFPAGSLGRNDARTDMLQLNLLHVNITGNNEVYPYSDTFSDLKYAFLFDDNDHYTRFFYETELIGLVNADLVARNMRLIDTILLGGMSGLFNTKQSIRSVEDIQGLRIRGSDTKELMMMNSWGLHSTQVAWEEIAQALETGIADGYLNPPLVPLMFGHTRQIKYFTNLGINPSTRCVVIANEWYQNLKPQRQKLFDKAVMTARRANLEWARKIQAKELTLLHKAGIKVTEISPQNRNTFISKYTRYMREKNLLKISPVTKKLIATTREKMEEK